MLETTLKSPLDCKEIKPVNPKGNQPWILIEKTGSEAETSILWPPDAKSWLIGKNADIEKDWRQEEKWVTEDEMVGWHHRFNGHEFDQALGVDGGQGTLACSSPWGHKEWTWFRNWTTTGKIRVQNWSPGELLSLVEDCSSWQETATIRWMRMQGRWRFGLAEMEAQGSWVKGKLCVCIFTSKYLLHS